MAAKSRKDELKAKEARQKKILAGLLVVLVLVGAIQVPKLMHHSTGNAAVVAATATETTPTEATAVPATGAPPSVASAGEPTGAVATGAAPSGSQLADTTVGPTASDGQLVQFGLFASKDPFVQQVVSLADQAAGASSESVSGSSSESGSGPTGGPGATHGSTTVTPAATPTAPAATTPSAPGGGFGPSGGTTTTTPAAPPTPTTAVALISVNGTVSTVPAAKDFPTASPLFHLLSFTADAAKVTIAGGAYADGRNALTLSKGVGVTLQNTVDGTKYRLVFQGSKKIPTAELEAQSSTATTPGATTTTPTTPTTTAPVAPTTTSAG